MRPGCERCRGVRGYGGTGLVASVGGWAVIGCHHLNSTPGILYLQQGITNYGSKNNCTVIKPTYLAAAISGIILLIIQNVILSTNELHKITIGNE